MPRDHYWFYICGSKLVPEYQTSIRKLPTSFYFETKSTMEPDQPLTPMGRFTIQPMFDSVINCTVVLEHPIDPESVRVELTNSSIFSHPRFCSLVVRDSHGVERWQKTNVDVDRHIIVHHNRLTDDSSVSDDDAVNDYVGELCYSSPLPLDKPLWEIHLLLAHKAAVFRVHHALGDGTSAMAVFLECLGRYVPPKKQGIATEKRKRFDLWNFVRMIWYTLVYVVGFLLRSFWRKDKTTVVSGGEGVELWPRRLATARFSLEDMKIVKRAVASATINDVLSGVVSSGLSKYLEMTSTKALQEGHQITGLVMVNVRPLAGLQNLSKLMESNLYGNKFGMILFPVYYHGRGTDPLQFLKTSKSTMDKKKLSLEALFSHNFGMLTAPFLGPEVALKLATSLHYRIMCNTSFLLSNVMGPAEEIKFVGNPVKQMKMTISSLPHAIIMHLVSYAGMANLQIQVAKDIIPQPKLLAKCFEDALLEMKQAAAALQ